MKHYLHIWALMMLLLHLSTLTAISFAPGERAGVSVKKVCLRKKAKKQLVASADKAYPLRLLLNITADTQSQQNDGDTDIHCSVKLISTAAAAPYVFMPLYLHHRRSGLDQAAYGSLSKFLEPDPPRRS